MQSRYTALLYMHPLCNANNIRCFHRLIIRDSESNNEVRRVDGGEGKGVGGC